MKTVFKFEGKAKDLLPAIDREILKQCSCVLCGGEGKWEERDKMGEIIGVVMCNCQLIENYD